jgi:translocation and assembly module TamA
VQGPVVRSLEIVGNEAVKDEAIKEGLFTQATPWYAFLPGVSKRRLDEVAWRADKKRIEAYYRARGYHRAEVLEAQVEPVGEDSVRLYVRVREGAPTRVTTVSLEGLEALPPEHRQAVEAALPLEEGDIFEEAAWEGLRATLASRLHHLGYAEARVDGEAHVDLGTGQAALLLKASPGVRYHMGAVQVAQKPSARVEAWRVEEQVNEALEPYDWYSPEALEEAQARVFDMGVFGAARVEPGEGDPRTGRVPLRVEVAEAPFHEVKAGLGIGFEQLRQEAHAVAGYTQRDFLGGLRRLDLEARAGYAFIPSAYTTFRGQDAVIRSGPVGGLSATLEQPRLFHPNFRLRTLLEVEREVEPAFTFNGGRARVGVQWKPRTWVLVEPSYNLELYALQAGATDLRGDGPELLFGCEGTCVLSYLEQRIVHDRRDDPQAPTRGIYLSLALQQGGGPLGGSFRYLRVVPEARAYRSVLAGDRLTFAVRGRVGTLIPLGMDQQDTPIVARFFSGGDGMRGFSTQRLSPMRLVEKNNPRGQFNAEPMPVGGNGLFEGSVEARYRLTAPITLALFMDTGWVSPGQLPLGQPGLFVDNLLWAVGTGVRYRTPVGPVRLDLAYRLPFGPPLPIFAEPGDPPLVYEPSAGCFGIGATSPARGGAPEGVCSLHLSIGEAF